MRKEIHGTGTYQKGDYELGDRKANAFASDAEDMDGLAERTNRAIGGVIKVAALNLRLYGFKKEASQLKREWKRHDGELQGLVALRRDIGDFKPLIQWLSTVETMLEYTLGWKLCDLLRITDLKTINYGIPVVFNQCKYGKTEAMAHTCGDLHIHPNKPMPYRGLMPVVAYWTTSITCSIATFGAGYFFICSPISWLVELAVDKKICPWLEPKIFDQFCSY